MTDMTTRILIAEDHDIARRGLRELLRGRSNLELVAEAGSREEALDAARETHPDIAVLGCSFSGINDRELTRELRQEHPDIEILIYTLEDREEVVMDVLYAGARGFVLKSDPERHLFAAIDALSAHRPYFSDAISETLLAQRIKAYRRQD